MTPAPELVGFNASERLSPRMRVLFVTNMWPEPQKPHYGTFIRSQAASLEAAGLAVDVLFVRGYISSHAYLAARRPVVQLMRGDRYDVVHVHTGHAATVGLPWAAKPTVISFVGGDLLGHPTEHGITRKSRFEAAAFRQLPYFAAATITKSEEMHRALPARAQRRNEVIPNGVDLQAFAPRPMDTARAALGWSADEKVVLFLGDPADPRKGFALAEEAVRLAQVRLPTARLHAAWGVSPEMVTRLMAAADCLVFPSLSEGSPNVVKEAMAAALPIVATPVGDIPERLQGVAGCYVVEGTADAFSVALVSAAAYGRAPEAREAVASLGLAAIAERVIAVYERAIRSG